MKHFSIYQDFVSGSHYVLRKEKSPGWKMDLIDKYSICELCEVGKFFHLSISAVFVQHFG